jgi:hypothetical protein
MTPERSGKSRSGEEISAPSALATIAIRRIGDVIRLDVSSVNPQALALVRQFVDTLNSRPFDPRLNDNSVFDRSIRLESVGLDEHGQVESVAFEADVQTIVFVVEGRHERRAAEFCRRHRGDLTTTEAMDDLAAQFEMVDRESRRERANALRRIGDWCLEQAADCEQPAEETPDAKIPWRGIVADLAIDIMNELTTVEVCNLLSALQKRIDEAGEEGPDMNRDRPHPTGTQDP